MDLGCYPISIARFYFEDEPTTAYASGEIDPEFNVDTRVAGLLEFPQGRALMDCSFSLPSRSDLEIVGESGVISIPRPWLPDPAAVICINGKSERLPVEDQYVNEFEHFSQCLLKGTSPHYGPEDAILQMRVIDAVRRSMETGQPEVV